MKPDEIFILCVLHCKPGAPIRAVTRPFGGKATLALCPICIEHGRILREKSGVELVSTPVKIEPAP